MGVTIHFSSLSHIGRCRSINQDNLTCNGQYKSSERINEPFILSGCIPSSDNTVFGVFDGMGGEECGEIASLLAAQVAESIKFDGDVSAALNRFCFDANERICQYAQEYGISSMGTTAAMLVFSEREIVLCNIGDSKVFQYSKGNLDQISFDHIAPSIFGSKPPLYQNLGIPPDELVIEPYISKGIYRNGDIYLICSDGLTDMLSVDEIKETLAAAQCDNITQMLLDKSLEKGGKDNITIIVCRVERTSLKIIDRIKNRYRRWKNDGK